MKLAVVLAAALLFATFPSRAQEAYEGWPTLKASELLRPDVVKGPYHTVFDAVPTRGFANQYTLHTNWGTYTVWGNDLLTKRIHETYAIAQLENASKSDEFKQALRTAAAKPIVMVGDTIKDPVGTVKGVGKGALRIVQRAGEAIQRGGDKGKNTDSTAKNLLGFSRQKRAIAHQLGVDPYTDNPVLQQRLDEMARASFAGGFVIRVGTFALSSGADVALAKAATTLSTTKNVSDALRDYSPTDLSGFNRTILLKAGISEATTEAFLTSPAISPTNQVLLSFKIQELSGVPGLEDFVKMVNQSQTTPDTRFFLRCANLMAVYHTKVSPIRRILNLDGLPAIHGHDNALVLPLGVDYASWNPQSDQLSAAIAAYNPQVEISRRVIYLSGICSPTARNHFHQRGFEVSDRAVSVIYR